MLNPVLYTIDLFECFNQLLCYLVEFEVEDIRKADAPKKKEPLDLFSDLVREVTEAEAHAHR